MSGRFGVWLRSCPRNARKKAAEILQPKLGLVDAERQVADAGGRCVTFHKTMAEAEELASALRDVGCQASAGEEASWP